MSRRTGRWAAVTALALLTLAGCGHSGGRPSATGATGSSLAPVSEDVQKAYLAYWDAWTAANTTSDPAAPALGQVTADPHLGVLQAILTQAQQQGRVVRGAVDHHIEGMEVVDDDSRRIVDCIDVRHWVQYDRSTGRLLDQLTERPRQLGVYTLRRVDGGWKVTDGQLPQPCGPQGGQGRQDGQ